MSEPTVRDGERAARRLRRRYRAERRFRAIGAAAIGFALLALAALLVTIVLRGYSGFTQHRATFEVEFSTQALGFEEGASRRELERANYGAVLKKALRDEFPEAQDRRSRRALNGLMSAGAAFELRDRLLADPTLLSQRVTIELLLSDDADLYFKGDVRADVPETDRRLDDRQLAWLDSWAAQGRVRNTLSVEFFTTGDSREPEMAGIAGALLGSLLTLAVTLLLSFPVGVAAAIYLEEFAPRNAWTDLVEVNINNLAAVPSIVFGLLGLAFFLNFLDLPRSAPVVGGMVLALMTLPTVVIASRSAIQSVPPSIREAALGVGASPMQVVAHHVLPLALPGILTGTIIGMGRALGETAPLLMIGMVAFIVDLPTSPLSPATALPVQIFLWADSPERAFVAKTSAAILVLLAFLIAMNLAAVLLRNRFERRW